jgi:hypothetical protein
MEKNKAWNKCLNRNTRVNREDYEQKRSEARNLLRKYKGTAEEKNRRNKRIQREKINEKIL